MNNLTDIRTEYEVIAACLSGSNIYVALSELLSADLFSDRDAREVYEIMRSLDESGKVVDITTAGRVMQSKGIDIAKFISNRAPSYEVMKEMVNVLSSLEKKRRLYTLCVKGMTIATTPMAEAEEMQGIITDMENITESGNETVINHRSSLKQLANNVVKRYEGKAETGIRTGLGIFDKRNGLHGGDLVIIAGETSNGKSTLATTIARNVALQGIPVVYYSLEMSAEQLSARILARDAKVAASRMLYAKLTPEEYNQFYDAMMKQVEYPIYYDDKNKTSFYRMMNSARSLVRKNGVRIIIVDYLQIMVNGEDGSREQMLGDMARDMKRMATETGACVILLSQLSRDQNSKYGEPSLSRMRGSGQIEEACDMAVLIWRPSLYGKEKYDDGTVTAGTAVLKLAKGRNVGIGSDIVLFDGDLMYFRDDDGSRQQWKPTDNPF